MTKMTNLRTWNFNATDLDATVRFYRDVLGAEEAGSHQARGVDVARLKIGNSGIGIFDAPKAPIDGVPHHTFDFNGPSDPQEMIRELESRGAKVENMRMHGNGPGYSLYLTDPAGNHLELSTDPT
jgi:predicted enzyme related to lactoylglutathione lyase